MRLEPLPGFNFSNQTIRWCRKLRSTTGYKL